MKIRLDYGTDGMLVELPADLAVTVIEPTKGLALPEPDAALADALAHPIGTRPLAELARGRRDAVIVISDKTRPVPNGLILPPILRTLEAAGIARDRIEILVATGLHRANTPDELITMTSREIVANYRLRNHVARHAAEHVHLGRTTRGTEIWLDRSFVNADLKIVTGLIEPHLMAGYSGGRKGVAPGLAGVDTMRSAHGAAMLEGNVGPGIIDNNPFHDDLLEIVRRVNVDFLVDVTLNRARQVTGVFAGHIEQAHAVGMDFVAHAVSIAIDAPADIVVTSGGGFPLDDTYYQSIKGMIAALNIVRPGGTIILAAALKEGIGSADFQQLLRETRGNDDFMARITTPGFFTIDQWMVQHLCQVLRKAQVIVVTDGLPADAVRTLLVDHAPTVESAVQRARTRVGTAPRLAVLPQGPYVLATVRGRRFSLGRAWMEQAA
ncbi:MAG TPA: nickel-dependent lactate racemase [Candidatus Binatia bacterium]|nr:nickel-dependent lactate racemase [Candidatus Binatia bacterium]